MSNQQFFRTIVTFPMISQESSVAGELRKQKPNCITQRSTYVDKISFVFAPNSRFSCLQISQRAYVCVRDI